MSTKVEVNVKVTGAQQATDEIADVGHAAEDTNETVGQMSGALDKMTGGMITAFRGIGTGLKGAVKGLKTFKGALMATGIGALIVLIGSLASYISNTAEGAGELEKTMGGLGGAMEPLKTRAAEMGKSLWEAVTNPRKAWEGLKSAAQGVWDTLKGISNYIKEAFLLRFAKMQRGILKAKIAFVEFTGIGEDGLKSLEIQLKAMNKVVEDFEKNTEEAAKTAAEPFVKLAENVMGVVEEMGNAYDLGKLLAEQAIRLRAAQRQLAKSFAEGRAQIKEYNMVAEDVTRTTDERVEAAKAAMEIEKNLMAQRQAAAAEELRIARARDAMGTTDEETLEELNQLEVNLINIRMESAEMQTTLQNKINAIVKEGIALKKQARDEEQADLQARYDRQDELEQSLLDEQEAEVQAVAQKYDKLYELAEEFGYGEAELTEKRNAELKAINDKYRKQEEDAEKASADKKAAIKKAEIQGKFNIAKAFLGLVSALNDKADGEDEQAARKAFARGKAIQMAGAVMATAQAVIAAIAAPPVGLGTPAGIPGAISAGLTGAAQIATIAKQKFPSAGGGGSSVSGAGSVSTPTMTMASVPDTFAQSATAPTGEPEIAQTPLRTYVVSTEVTTAQQLDSEISNRATL